ncbi:MAG TPA: NAD-dependent epimerase/dehydratase family protein [Spirochaetia bacterium]
MSETRKGPGLQVVFGTGPIGTATARELLRRGLSVRMVSRSGRLPPLIGGAGVEGRTVDAFDREAVLAATEGATHIYHCLNVPYQDWYRDLAPLQENLLAAAREHGAVLGLAENLYMYKRGVPVITEETPEEAPTRKGRLRRELHDALAREAAQSGVRWAAVRASDYYGPGAGLQSVAFGSVRFLDPLFAGKRPAMIGDPDVPHTYTYSFDYGRALATATLDPAAHGKAWIVPNDRTLTTREVAALFFKEAGIETTLSVLPRFALTAYGLFNPVVRELGEMLYQREEPYVVEGSLFATRFGFVPTRLEDGIAETIRWYTATREPRKVA